MTEDEDVKPLPCPFCGRAPIQNYLSDGAGNDRAGFAIGCQCRGAQVEGQADERVAIIKHWNRRAP